MDSVIGEDPTLPLDFNGSSNVSKLPDITVAAANSPVKENSLVLPNITSGKLSPVRARTMKEFETEITELKKENFNLKLRIYFLEERMQQKFDCGSEDIFKMNIELKVELESLKRELKEKQGLLVKASKAVESLAGNNDAEIQRVKDGAQKEILQVKQLLSNQIQVLEEDVKTTQEELEKMAAIAEQEKIRSISLEKQILTINKQNRMGSPLPPEQTKNRTETEQLIDQLNETIKSKDVLINQLQNEKAKMQDSHVNPSEKIQELTEALLKKAGESEALRGELGNERNRFEKEMQNLVEKQRQLGQLEVEAKQLKDDLETADVTISTLQEKLKKADGANKILQEHANEKENELVAEKQNSLKRDKTIQGLTLALKAKDKEIEELCHEIEDRDNTLVKARDSIHKAQLQKFQGAEEYQSLMTEKETELAELRTDRNGRVMEIQKLQRALNRREQELNDLTEAKDQLEEEMEGLQLQKAKDDKTINDIQNHIQKLGAELTEKERAMEHKYQTLLTENKQKLQSQELVIERLTDSLNNKDRLLQDYMELAKGVQQGGDQSPNGKDALLAKLRDRLKEKDRALEQAIDQKHAAVDEKENEIQQLHLALREREHDFDRLKSLLANNEETINRLDGMIKEKDVELQHLANTCKNLQRAKQELEDNQAQSLREKDAIISQLQQSLKNKTENLEEMTNSLLSQAHCGTKDLAEQLNQRLKVKEKMLEDAWAEKKQLSAEHEKEIADLLNAINSKDQLLKEASERYNRRLSELSRESRGLNRQCAEKEQDDFGLLKHDCLLNQEQILEMAQLKAALDEKDKIINKLMEHGQKKDQYFAQHETPNPSHILELKQTIQILQEQLHERKAELNQHEPAEDEILIKMPQHEKSSASLKRELAEKTEELNSTLKKENKAKMEVARLKSFDKLEKDIQTLVANVESLSKVMLTKDEIIKDLQSRLSSSEVKGAEQFTTEVIVLKDDIQRPDHPPRERTIIGGDSQQSVPTLEDQMSKEHLHHVLKSEQQLYSRLIKAVKEPDSCSRIQALQMELTAIQLLRQQLEESIQINQNLQRNLEQQIQEAKRKEDTASKADMVDFREIETLRHQLEDTQRWNVSLQSRLGQMQARAGGVGAANDSGDTFTSYGDQTSYLSICLGPFDDLEQEIVKLSLPELRQKVIELQKCLKALQANNQELQDRIIMSEHSTLGSDSQEKQDVPTMAAQIKLLNQRLEESVKMNEVLQEQPQSLNQIDTHHLAMSKDDKCIQTTPEVKPASEIEPEQQSATHGLRTATEKNRELNVSVAPSDSVADNSLESAKLMKDLSKINCELEDKHQQLQEVQRQLEMTECQLHEMEAKQLQMEEEINAMRLLMEENGVSSVSDFKSEVGNLRTKIIELRDQHGEDLSICQNEDTGEETSDENEDSVRKEVQRLRIELKNRRKIRNLLEQQVELNCCGEGENCFNPDLIVNMANEIEHLKAELEIANQEMTSVDRSLKEVNAKEREGFQGSKLPRSESLELGNSEGKATEQEPALSATTSTRSRLPVPLRRPRSVSNVSIAASSQDIPPDHQHTDQLRTVMKDYKRLQSKLYAAEATLVSQAEKLKLHCIPLHAELSLKQDDKEVQVDVQDLGYETCGKSENDADRDESSSPDTVSHLPGHHYGDSAIPSLLKLNRRFFSMENLDTNSSTSYPSSPSLISPKISLKNLDVFDDYGQTDDVNELKLQIAELKEQIEKYQKIIRHLQACMRKNSLSSEQLTVSDHSHQATMRGSYEGHSLDSIQKDDDSNHSQRRHSIQSPDLSVQNTQKIGNLSNHESRSPSMDFGSQSEKGDWLVSNYPQDEQQVQKLKEQMEQLEDQLQKEKARNEELQDRLHHLQTKLAAPSPAQKYDSLVQSQARELSHLRQQIKESFNICTLHHQTLVDLTKAFEKLLQASDVDYYVGEAFRDQLNQSLQLVETLENKFDGGDVSSVDGDRTLLDFSQSPHSLQYEVLHLRKQLENERKQLHKQLNELLRENQALSQATKEQHEQLSKEVQEKNKIIYCLQQQLSHQSYVPSTSQVSSDSEMSDGNSISSPESRSTTSEPPFTGENKSKSRNSRQRSFQRRLSHRSPATNASTNLQNDPQNKEASLTSGLSTPDGKTQLQENVEGIPVPHEMLSTRSWPIEYASAQTSLLNQRLLELQKENSVLREQLVNKEDLNETLRTELDLHRSILTENQQNIDNQIAHSLNHRDRSLIANKQISTSTEPEKDLGLSAADLLAEHLHEIRSLRQRLEESIRNNDRLRQQLERRLAESEHDPASTNIFIHGTEEHSHLADEIHYVKEQNKALKEQLTRSSKDKQRENEKLKESLSKKTAATERLRSECERAKRENSRLQTKVTNAHEESRRLKNELHCSHDEINRLQRELGLQSQLFTENQQLLQSLRMELRVYEQLEERKTEPAQQMSHASVKYFQGSIDLSDLLTEIHCLRIQLERSIQTNTALRQKLEEQLQQGQFKNEGSPSTININYLLAREQRHSGKRHLFQGFEADVSVSADDGKENFQSHEFPTSPKSANIPADVNIADGSMFGIPGIRALPKDEYDGSSHYSDSSIENLSHKPSRFIPAHWMWADKNGQYVLGSVGTYSVLRKQISESRSLLHGMDTRLGDVAACQSTSAKEPGEPLLKYLSSTVRSMKQMFEEAGHLLKRFWRVSLPIPAANSSHHTQEKTVRDEIYWLRKKLTEQEKLLHGTVKRLRTTNQIKEGMEKVIINQLSLTHDVLKKARGNLEMNHYMVFDLKGFPKQSEADPTFRSSASKWKLTNTVHTAAFNWGSSEEACSTPEEKFDSLTSSFCSY
ncbi:CDK5 regulatory subunit-associated protein 2 isoform X3 [Carcharodon carcharias]|uniref:CDK5 regulatory subunit-associated protein 2 isoform X3 n=1 Tax=Carcharodon carcharias TaxID=13397 RepID=UPI001B7D9FC4|nr:CDK5 regulatory subunit-associated protein 2 isoform X3 [Carcharodon carcharias]